MKNASMANYYHDRNLALKHLRNFMKNSTKQEKMNITYSCWSLSMVLGESRAGILDVLSSSSGWPRQVGPLNENHKKT